MTPYYEQDGIVIYHGDCREILPTLPKVDAVVTDPPYGIGEAAGRNKSRGKLAEARDYGNASWDACTAQDVADTVVGWGIPVVWFGGNYYSLPPSGGWLVWHKDTKPRTSDFSACELAWTNVGGAVKYKQFLWAGMWRGRYAGEKEQRWHPTQKPVDVMKWAIEHVGVSLILDPFMGSGTTLRAAKDLGRKAIGIEIEEEYCEIAAKRMAQGVLPL